ncbi:MAG: hypothetical protein ACR2O6_09390 [Ilumatobacteraceae bacterium]
MRRNPPLAVLSLAAAVTLTATACQPDDETADDACAPLVADATGESEPDAQVRLLDEAMVVCRSYSSFTTELDRYPSSIGYDTATYVTRRCANADDVVRDSPTCSSVISPTATTAPQTTVVDLLFVGDTVDGRPIEIRPSDGIEFVGEVPAVVQQTVDIAFEAGCDGVIAQRDLWAALIDDSPAGDIASVYAQHAQNVADFIQCDTEPIVVG